MVRIVVLWKSPMLGGPLLIKHLQSHSVLDVVVDDEIQFLVGEAVVFGEDAVDFVDYGFACCVVESLNSKSTF